MTVHPARISLALLCTLPLASVATAQKVEYSPGATRYHLTTTTKVTQTMMGNASNLEVGVDQIISVNLARSATDTITATVTLDSISMKSAGPTPDFSKMTGQPFTAFLSPTGKLYSSKSPAGIDPALAQIVDGMARFLPQHRGSLAQGLAWADTTSGKVNQQGLDVDRTVITNFKVAGDTTIGTQKAVRIERTSTVKATGTGNMQGTPVSMESTGKSTGAFYISPSGVYLGAISDDDVDVKVTIIGQNMDVLIKQAGTTKVETIK